MSSFLSAKYRRFTNSGRKKQPRAPLLPKLKKQLSLEPLESRVLLSVLDFADQVIQEIEPNDVTPGQEISFDSQTLAIGVEAEINPGNDVDFYTVQVDQTGQMDLLLEITQSSNQEITGMEVTPQGRAFFLSGNSLWTKDLSEEDSDIQLWASRSDLALAADLEAQEVNVSDLALTSQGTVLITISSRADVLAIDPDQNITLVISNEDFVDFTNEAAAELLSVSVDSQDRIYLADQQSRSVLQLTAPQSQGDPYDIQYYASAEDLQDALNDELFNNILTGVVETERTVIAQPEEGATYQPNALIEGSGVYSMAGYDIYYTSHLGPDFDGDGSITRVAIDQSDPEQVTFTLFFDPQTSAITSEESLDPDTINPSALAMDTGGDFGSRMFVGSFGPSLGDEQDGRIFTVDEDGNLTEFVITEFIDPYNGEEFTGFFDITDMAFSSGGAFGTYLYVLSENNDSNGQEEGGFSSDLWRISPDGRAELFVPDLADGVISLAFSSGADITYAGNLFVSTYTDGGTIYRVSSDGQKSIFYDFGQFGDGSYMTSNLAFGPYLQDLDSPMEGSLIVDVVAQGNTYIFRLPAGQPPNEVPEPWIQNLNSGDVSSGDLLFNSQGDLIIALGGDQNLTQVHYQSLLDYTFQDLQTRSVTTEEEVEGSDPQNPEFEEVTSDIPYVLLSMAQQPRIVSLGEVDASRQIIFTEASPASLDLGETPEDGSRDIAFTFDDNGDIYVYMNNGSVLQTSERTTYELSDGSSLGQFTSFTNLMDGEDIPLTGEINDPHISHLAFQSDGSLYGIAQDNSDPQDPPVPTVSDAIMLLGNTIEAQPSEVLISADQLTQFQVNLTGPDFSRIYTVNPAERLEEMFQNLTEGAYTISVSPQTPSTAEYELLISLGGQLQNTILIDQTTGPVELTHINGDTLQILYDGPGRAELTLAQRPTGYVVELTSIILSDTRGSSSLQMTNINNPEAIWSLDEITLDGSLGQMSFPGSVDQITSLEQTRGNIASLDLRQIGSVQAQRYRFLNVYANQLGDENEDENLFQAETIQNLYVRENIHNITFLEAGSTNRYRNITVGGRISESTFFGYSIDRLLVSNALEPDQPALDTVDFTLDNQKGYFRSIQIDQGDVFSTAFTAGKKIQRLEIKNGNLEESFLYAAGKLPRIDRIIINRLEGTPDENAGNIIGSTISTIGPIKYLFAAGAIDQDSSVSSSGFMRSQIDQIITGGDLMGSVSATRIKNLWVGYNQDLSRKDEDDTFTGANLGADVSSILDVQNIKVTGAIENAYISTSSGSIKTIVAEDGFLNSTLSVRDSITRIMLGYLDGNRGFNHIVNAEADLTGAIYTRSLGRIYYTGIRNLTLQISGPLGPIHDDVPTISVTDVSLQEDDASQSTADFLIELSQPSAAPITIDYTTLDDTATTENDDYQFTSGTITFKPGQTEAIISVPVTSDDLYELNETFSLQLTNRTYPSLEPLLAEATILNDDQAPIVRITENVSLPEGNTDTTAFSFDLWLELPNPTSLPASITVSTADSTATVAGNDYQNFTQTITFEPSQALSQSITITVIADTNLEADETFLINLTSSQNCTIALSQATGLILNDD